jgi:hypothetical protein
MVMDYFGFPAVVAFARAIDSVDLYLNKIGHNYQDVYPDIMEGLDFMYGRNRFNDNSSPFFEELKRRPDLYLRKCSPHVLDWLSKIKNEKFSILVTGTNVDFAEFTASYCLGPKWKEFFHTVACFAMKKNFTKEMKPFEKLDDEYLESIPVEALSSNESHCIGRESWASVRKFYSDQIGMKDPTYFFVGDNIIHDLYTQSKFGGCYCVAILEEYGADYSNHPHADCILSKRWGPFLRGHKDQESHWAEMIGRHSLIRVPNLRALAAIPLSTHLQPYEYRNMKPLLGYYYPS